MVFFIRSLYNNNSNTIIIGYSCKDFLPRTTGSYILPRMIKEAKKPTLRPEFLKKVSMTNPAKSLTYVKCYSLSELKPIKSSSIAVISAILNYKNYLHNKTSFPVLTNDCTITLLSLSSSSSSSPS